MPIENESPPSTFTNPYLNAENNTRVNFNVSGEDYAFLKSIEPSHGVLTITMAILLKKFIYELKSNNITQYDPDSYRRCLIASKLVFPFAADFDAGILRSTITNTDRPNQAIVANDGRGTKSMAQQTTPTSTIASGVERTSSTGKKGTKSGKSKPKSKVT